MLRNSSFKNRNDDFGHSATPKSPVFSIIMPLPWHIHAWLAHLNGSLICLNVRPFLPMAVRQNLIRFVIKAYRAGAKDLKWNMYISFLFVIISNFRWDLWPCQKYRRDRLLLFFAQESH